MRTPRATLYFDFADPVSYLVERELRAALEGYEALAFEPFENRPPPSPLLNVGDASSLQERWTLAREVAESQGLRLAPPGLVPWSRKAHELHLFARSRGIAQAMRTAIHEAYLLDGRDIGRVDVLVRLGIAAGLDRTETKAVLDVDRHLADVLEARARASEAGVTEAPVLVTPSARLRGFHNRSTLRTFLRDVPEDAGS